MVQDLSSRIVLLSKVIAFVFTKFNIDTVNTAMNVPNSPTVCTYPTISPNVSNCHIRCEKWSILLQFHNSF